MPKLSGPAAFSSVESSLLEVWKLPCLSLQADRDNPLLVIIQMCVIGHLAGDGAPDLCAQP